MLDISSAVANAPAPKTVYLREYQQPAFLIDNVTFTFDLDEERTIVHSQMAMRRNPKSGEKDSALVLNGEKISLISIKIDGKTLHQNQYRLDEHSLTILKPPQKFLLEIENSCCPKENTALEGLYKSGKILCTQNEPEGFRRITYFLDRSDVMTKFRTKLIADEKLYPILLSNGNEVGRGKADKGKHWVEWEDPFLKPSYLFAIVAGDLGQIKDKFTTMSGRTIDLHIYCDKGNEGRCQHAMTSLKKSMKWDEDVFGLEYDLDIFMIVAVDAFNMGAMENKGLNIFNTNAVLADVDTATDDNFNRIEGIVAHEYFHNWTGNRVTCRDWFQLTLKEGLTVFRDQEFSGDMHSSSVERIEDVLALRTRQFSEDAGPTAHPIKPSSYIEINNFYTATVYNKGAEVIRMIRTLIGKEAFRKGMDKYFELYDGQAVTTEDFVHAMELASGRNFTQFKRWYHQAGTPRLKADWKYHPENKTLELTLEQHCAPTADKSPKEPFHIPCIVGFLGPDGKELNVALTPAGAKVTSWTLELTESKKTFVFHNVSEKPIPSLNRRFSAPIKLDAPYTFEDYLFLMAHDSDDFNRWEAGQEIATRLILDMAKTHKAKKPLALHEGFSKSFGLLLADSRLDMALKAKAMQLPSETVIAERMTTIDTDSIHAAKEFLTKELSKRHHNKLLEIYQACADHGPYKFEAQATSRRALKNTCLDYLAHSGSQEAILLCENQYNKSTNMTDQFAALACLADIPCPERGRALQSFYKKWKDNLLVMTKWFSVQALSKLSNTLEEVIALENDPAFKPDIPNLTRALYNTFAANLPIFHAKDGSGYRFVADKVIELDKKNPLVAARLAEGFRKYAYLDSSRQELMKEHLERILKEPTTSPNVYEIVTKTLSQNKPTA